MGFTGVDAPYEPPRNPEMRVDGAYNSAEVNARLILEHLTTRGFVRVEEYAPPANGSAE